MSNVLNKLQLVSQSSSIGVKSEGVKSEAVAEAEKAKLLQQRKSKYLEALESDKYTQIYGHYCGHEKGQFCAIGLAYYMLHPEKSYKKLYEKMEVNGEVSRELILAYHLSYDELSALVQLNDIKRRPFKHIAHLLRQKWEMAAESEAA